MSNHETSADRYRRLAAECRDVADNFPRGEHRDALWQMAQVWQRLANQHEGATAPLCAGTAPEQAAVQQQQQIQSDDDKEE